MSINKFFQLIQVKAKLASFISFSLGSVYAIYEYKRFNLSNFIIMFISVMTFAMATTAINNYIDDKKDKSNSANNNFIDKYGVNESIVVFIIFTLLTIATISGIMLTLNTNIIVLLVGIMSFGVGVFYTFGPIPISRMPLGEIFSGFFEGFIVIFLSVYIHIYDNKILFFTYQNNLLSINVNILEVLSIFLFAIPTIVGIANIMLANNICDLEEDILNDRFTLPYYIGKPMALKLFKLLYYIGYADIVISVVLKMIPLASLLILLTLIMVNKNLKLFQEEQVKNKTFSLSIKNFVLMNATQVIIVGIVIVLSHYC